LRGRSGDLFRLVGNEPLVALDRIVSQEVKSLRGGEVRLALLLAPKGQFRALLAVSRCGEDVLLLAPRGRGPELAEKLALYLKFNRIAIEPSTWDDGCRLVVGGGWARVAGALGVDAAGVAGPGCVAVGVAGARVLAIGQTFAGGGMTVFGESAAALARLDEALLEAGAAAVDEAAVERRRVVAGFPAWGRELTDTVLPPEVGIDRLAVSYTKGCYVGQETMARMKTYGHPNRQLVQVQQVDGPLQQPDLPLELLPDGGDRSKGRLTSWVLDGEGTGIGLALVHRSVAAGAALLGAGRSFSVTRSPAW